MDKSPKTLPLVGPLVFFEAVARTGSFTQAAEELYLTQSAVSKQIRKLEDNLGFPLFTRKHRGVALTEPGRMLYDGVQPALDSFRDTVQRVRNWHDQDSFSILCTHAVAHYYLFPRLAHFQQRFPHITVNVVASNLLTPSSCLNHDFAILYGDGDWSGLSGVKLFDEEVYPICAPDYPVGHIHTLDDLLAQPLIQLDTAGWNCMNWNDWLRYYDREFKPGNKVITYNQVTLAMQAAEQGLGIALGWEFMARQMIDKGAVLQLERFSLKTGRADYLVHPSKTRQSEACRVFQDWLLSDIAAGIA